MTVLKFIFSFLFILAITNVRGQSQEATIRFETKFLKNQRIEFNINGLNFIPDDKKHKIGIYKTNLDTLIYRVSDKQMRISLLKFKENTEYIIRLIPCSFYDIRPVNKPRKGVVRYNITSSKLDSVSVKLDLYSQKIISGKRSEYYSFRPSVNCYFGKKKIAFTDSKSHEDISYVYFNFLHGEKLTFSYDINTQVQRLILNGYLKDEESYSGMEIMKY